MSKYVKTNTPIQDEPKKQEPVQEVSVEQEEEIKPKKKKNKKTK